MPGGSLKWSMLHYMSSGMEKPETNAAWQSNHSSAAWTPDMAEPHLEIRQKRRRERVRKAKRKSKIRAASMVLLYFAVFTVIYTFLCSKKQPCDALEDQECEFNWTIVDSLYFITTTITTVGFGDLNLLNETVLLKVLFIVQSASGILLISGLVLEAELDNWNAELSAGFIIRAVGEEHHPDLDIKNRSILLHMLAIRVLLVWIVGSIFYSFVEHLSAPTSIYFCWVSMSTIGLGDIKPETQGGKLFTSCFLIIGCTSVANLLGSIVEYRLDNFNIRNMRTFLQYEHTPDSIKFFDRIRDGQVHSGEFLTTYLVSLGKVRSVTCDEIMEKFWHISMGKKFIDTNLFMARSVAISSGKAPGRDAAKQAMEDGASPEEQAARAGRAAGQAAAECRWKYEMKNLSEDELRSATQNINLMLRQPAQQVYDQLSQQPILNISTTEATLKKMLHVARAAKNYKVKVALSAGQAAGEAARSAGLDDMRVGYAAAIASRDAGGSIYEQQKAAGDAIARSIKLAGGAYAAQANARSAQDGTGHRNVFLAASRPSQSEEQIPQIVGDDGVNDLDGLLKKQRANNSEKSQSQTTDKPAPDMSQIEIEPTQSTKLDHQNLGVDIAATTRIVV